VDSIPHFPKGSLKKSAHNPHARAEKNYSIVEDLAQAPFSFGSPPKVPFTIKGAVERYWQRLPVRFQH
jgi:hypothetical protein